MKDYLQFLAFALFILAMSAGALFAPVLIQKKVYEFLDVPQP